MYIQPNSTIELYSNMPLDQQYNDTCYFGSSAEQDAYFTNSTNKILTLNAYSYVRKGRGTIRFEPVNWNVLVGCNYMRFKNTSFENKWFYAFVTSCEYMNNGTCLLSFTIDVMQTWFFGTNAQQFVKKSFVIRQHDINDGIGNNIEPEPIQLNEYVTNGVREKLYSQDDVGFIVAIADTDNKTSGGISGGIYSGATLYYYDNATDIDNKVNQYLQKPDSILAIYCVPKSNYGNGSNVTNIGSTLENATASGISAGQAIDGYVPHNNKCYTYPFTFLRVFTTEGNYADFRYEFFKGNPEFNIHGTLVQPVKTALFPSNYKVGNTKDIYFMEGVSITSYPVCSWNSDAYAAWVAQNSVPMNNLTKAQENKITIRENATRANETLTGINGFTSALLDAIPGGGFNPDQGIKTGINTLTSMLGQENNMQAQNKIANIDFNTNMQNAYYTASVQADTIHGTIAGGNLALAFAGLGYYATRMCQPHQVMERVDSYFDMYGYAVNKLAGVNLHGRPHWNYCRVSDIQLGNSFMPADAVESIKSIFENGIRFWNNMSEIGNFNLDNRPN